MEREISTLRQIRVVLKSTSGLGWEREVLAEPKVAEGPMGPEHHYRVRVWGYPGAFLVGPLLDLLLPAQAVESVLAGFGVATDSLVPGTTVTISAKLCSTLPFTDVEP